MNERANEPASNEATPGSGAVEAPLVVECKNIHMSYDGRVILDGMVGVGRRHEFG